MATVPNFDAARKLFHACTMGVLFRGNTYDPHYLDPQGGLRCDAHLHATRKFAAAVIDWYAEDAYRSREAKHAA